MTIQKPLLPADARSFYHALFVLVGPIALQNLITAAVSSADVIMLGYVGQTAIAAVSLAGQIQFVLTLFFTGMSSGLIMLTAQYWGRKDTAAIETLTGIVLRISCATGILFTAVAFVFPRALMRIFTNDEALISTGADYLRIVSFSYVLLSVSQIYQAVLKSIEHVRIVTALTASALILNVFLNSVFIFGLFGVPRSGVKGVAFATTLSRMIELVLTTVVSLRVRSIRLTPAVICKRNKLLFGDFARYSLPALGNELVWGAAFSMYSVIMGHMGQDIVAANSVVNVARNLASVLCFGMAYGGAILIGKEMGAGCLEQAKKDASRLCRSTIAAGVLGGVLLILFHPLVFRIAVLTPQAVHFLNIMIYINAFSIVGASINTVIICGIFRAGGDAQFGFIMDTICMWCVSVPLGLVCAFVLKLPPIIVYLVLYLDEFEKMPVVVHHYLKGTWVKNITRDFSGQEHV
jgi:putative efflux protein, MATE family